MTKNLDVSPLRCPRAFIEVKLAVRELCSGDVLKVTGANEQLYHDMQKIQQKWQLQLEFTPPSELIITI